ncbi:MAG: radical SAM protein [Candidatus Omnitrophica bacterium]|nr:radical SAM protein [Candidatus Omnitrophota bacterium]
MKLLRFLKWKLMQYIIRIPALRYLGFECDAFLRKYWSKLFYNLTNAYFDKRTYDVLLIYPKSDVDKSILPPYSLLSVAGPLIKQGYRVKIIDQRIDPKCANHIARILKRGIICVGVTFYTGSQIKYACQLIDYIKEHYPSVKIIAGGFHASLLPYQTVQYNNIDIVVIGEGERTFLDLVAAIEKNTDLNDIHGIIFKEDNKIIRTRKRESINLNDYYAINHSAIIKYNLIYPINTLFTTRGCNGNCSFCAVPVLYPERRTVRPELVIEKIKEILKTGIQKIYFLDDNFFADFKRVEEILNLIIEKKLDFSWWAESRIDQVLKWEDEFLIKLKKCGLSRLYLGAESGSDRVLKMINKNITVDMIINANLRLKKSGIIAEFTFMAGFPTESPSEMKQTQDLIVKIKKDNPRSLIWRLNKYTPYPGTRLFDLCLNDGFSPPESLKEWSDIHFYRSAYDSEYEKELY